MSKDIELIVSSGVSGPCVYLNDFRIAGPKPWGGGRTLYSFKVSVQEIEAVLVNAAQGKRWADQNVRLGKTSYLPTEAD